VLVEGEETFWLGSSGLCYWTYGGAGERITCADEEREAVFGRCGSGAFAGCGLGRFHGILCCGLDEYYLVEDDGEQ